MAAWPIVVYGLYMYELSYLDKKLYDLLQKMGW